MDIKAGDLVQLRGSKVVWVVERVVWAFMTRQYVAECRREHFDMVSRAYAFPRAEFAIDALEKVK